MSSFYDDASLVVIPSGYKTSKVYAEKPTDGSGDLAFTRTGDTATRVNSAGLIVPVLANVPRLDYLGSTCPRLLLEPQRTNLALYSEQFNNASGWAAFRASITANAIVSPDGTANAENVTEDTNNGTHEVAPSSLQTVTSGIPYAASFFFKAGTRTRCALILDGNAFDSGGAGTAIFNLSTGVIISTSGGASATIENYNNGWYRCTITKVAANTSGFAYFQMINNSNQNIYVGDGTSFFSVWGAQFETGSYVSSYIPTLAASATRGADQASKTGISSLIGQQEGVWYWEGNLPQVSENGAASSVGLINTARNVNVNTAISFQYSVGTSTISTAFWVGDGTFTPLVDLLLVGYAAGSYVKVAFAYKSGSFAAYVNGALIQSSSNTFTSTTTMSEIYYHDNTVYYSYTGQQKVSQSLLFKTRLTNASLAELTTL